MSTSYEAMRRHWYILSRIPKYPSTITTKALQHRLSLDGIEASLRMLQRDLNYLSSLPLFPISSEEHGRQFVWFWPKDSRSLSLPSMTTSVAMTLYLTRRYLGSLMPLHLLEELQPYFSSAEAILESAGDNTGRWRDKIAFIDAGPQFSSLALPQNTGINDIYEALFREKQISAIYKPRNQQEKPYTLHPLGITAKGHRLYLVAADKNGQVKQFFIQRFISVDILDNTVVIPDGFSLTNYIDELSAFDYPRSTEKDRIELLVDKRFIYYFHETDIGQCQTITEHDDGRFKVTAESIMTDELLWWLLGRIGLIEIVQPVSLRKQVIATLNDALTRYA